MYQSERPSGGAKGNRTPDLRIANATLYQLSYSPSRSGLPYNTREDRQNHKVSPRIRLARDSGVGELDHLGVLLVTLPDAREPTHPQAVKIRAFVVALEHDGAGAPKLPWDA